jgi:hypothetical protein
MLLIAACPPTLPSCRTVVLYRDLASMFIATSPYPHVPFFSLSSAVQHVMLQMMSDIFLHHSNFLSDPKIQKFYWSCTEWCLKSSTNAYCIYQCFN